jgi:hypothetical protein
MENVEADVVTEAARWYREAELANLKQAAILASFNTMRGLRTRALVFEETNAASLSAPPRSPVSGLRRRRLVASSCRPSDKACSSSMLSAKPRPLPTN